ncbi:MAG: efflux RND transporter permease subunit, partial [Acidobacteria bacterium]|nr:efflux RND transporter permease subunit [Acidobacteriota bacterium]
SQIFAFCLGGYRLPRLQTGEREVAMLLDVDPYDVTNMEDVKKITITANGRPVQIGSLADFTIESSAMEIQHLNRKTTLEVSGTYEGDNSKEATKKVEEMMKALRLPPGYSWAFGEQIRETEEQNRQMVENLLLALVLVYFVMSALFESLIHPFAMLFAVPFAGIGAVWFLFVTKTPFNIMAQIGLLILIGIVVNNGIILIDHVNRKRREGLSREEAIVEGGKERLRPILMTALTTIFGLMPLAFGRSSGGQLYYFPLARTVMGGLAASTFLTLLVLPQIYLLFDSIGTWGRRVWTRASA